MKINLWVLNGLRNTNVVGGRERQTVEKLKKGEMKNCLCMKSELLYQILMEHKKLVCVFEMLDRCNKVAQRLKQW